MRPYQSTNDTRTVQLTLLTPVHVGTGEKFHPSAGFEYFAQERLLALLDDEKVLAVLGPDAGQIDQWVSLIHRQQSVLPLLLQRKKDLRAADVARRTLHAPAGPGNTQELRPQMHTGPAGEVPYLPGSALKGAIRTALLATELRSAAGARHLYQFPQNDKVRSNWSATGLTESVFSPNAPKSGLAPNYDWLKLLHVGDVAFEPGSTECLKAHAFNQRGQEEEARFIDDKPHLLEVLPEGGTGLGSWQLATALRDQASLGGPGRQLSWQWLLPVINAHTGRLLERELQRLPAQHSAEYAEELRRLLRETRACEGSDSEAVLRLGFGSGHPAMTGDWLDLLRPDQREAVIRASRPRNENYAGYAFPKSRKLLPGDRPLGFVKIRLLTAAEAARQQAARAAQAAQAAAEQQQRQQQAAQAAEAARLPQYFTGKVKPGTELDAVVEKFVAPMLTLRLYTGGPGLEQTVQTRYVGGMAVGAVCVVKVNSDQKGRVQAVTVVREKK